MWKGCVWFISRPWPSADEAIPRAAPGIRAALKQSITKGMQMVISVRNSHAAFPPSHGLLLPALAAP
jgi:hypothetical protein